MTVPVLRIQNKFYWLATGPDPYRDCPFHIELLVWPRPELMDLRDRGRMILCLVHIQITWGWRCYFRSDVNEIAERLAQP